MAQWIIGRSFFCKGGGAPLNPPTYIVLTRRLCKCPLGRISAQLAASRIRPPLPCHVDGHRNFTKIKLPFSINLKKIEVYFALKLKVKNHFLVKNIKEIDRIKKKVNEFEKIKRNSRIMVIHQKEFSASNFCLW